MSQPVAYFINQYPKVSHTFIRREIAALEAAGIVVARFAIRGWNAVLADPEDKEERARTRYVLQSGIAALALALAKMLFLSPKRLCRAFALTFRVARGSNRTFLYHLAYLAEACRLTPWLCERGVRHLHAHFGTNSAEVAMLAKALGGPSYSFTVHGPDEFDRPEQLQLQEKVRHAKFVVAVSSYGRSQLYRWIRPVDRSKVAVVHCGLEPAFYDVPERPLSSAPRLVCIGRLSAQKGQFMLIEAARVLAARGTPFEIVLVGDGDTRSELESAIARYSLADKVRITGWVSSEEVREQIIAARALVLPSFAEGVPVVLMEAMALRRPVLTTYVAGIPELVKHGEHGWLFPAGDLEALVRAMEDCLSRSTDELRLMGNAARNRALARHQIGESAKKLLRLFDESVT